MLGGVVFSTLRTFLADNAGIGLRNRAGYSDRLLVFPISHLVFRISHFVYHGMHFPPCISYIASHFDFFKKSEKNA